MTDEYVLGAIRDVNLNWQEHPQGGFVTMMNEVTIHITFFALTLSRSLKKITIYNSRTLFKKSAPLEHIFKEIRKQAADQCLKHDTDEYQKNLRNEILSQLTGLNV